MVDELAKLLEPGEEDLDLEFCGLSSWPPGLIRIGWQMWISMRCLICSSPASPPRPSNRTEALIEPLKVVYLEQMAQRSLRVQRWREAARLLTESSLAAALDRPDSYPTRASGGW